MNKPTPKLLALFRKHPEAEKLLYIAQPYRLSHINQILCGVNATSEEIRTLLTILNKTAKTHYELKDVCPEKIVITNLQSNSSVNLNNQIRVFSSSVVEERKWRREDK